jgi:hypothetical protein
MINDAPVPGESGGGRNAVEAPLVPGVEGAITSSSQSKNAELPLPRLVAPVVLASLLLAACVPREPGLTAAEEYDIRRSVPDADLSDLTPAQVGALSDALHHGDGFDLPYRIQSILMW